MGFTYNLLKEAWIPCKDQEEILKLVNIVDAVTDAHKLKNLQADTPITTASLYLFLLAFVSAIFKPEDDGDWEEIWQNGSFSREKVMDYTEKWKERFNLFDEKHPFFQDMKIGKRKADKEKLKKENEAEPKGLAGFLLHVASGTNPTLFDHSMDDRVKHYTPEQAAQLLIMLQSFSLGGMTSASISGDKYYKDCAFSRGILFLSKGNNLFETIMLNLIPREFDQKKWEGIDQPAWEKIDAFEEEKTMPGGICDLLTWQSRRILLLPEEIEGKTQIVNCYAAPGLGLVETFTNPFYHIRFDKTGTEIKAKLMRFMTGRALWRDSGALLDLKTQNADAPISIKWFGHLRAEEIIPNNMIRLELFGSCTKPANKKAYFYAQETFTAPAVYLENELLLAELKTALSWAEDVRTAIYFTSNELASYKLSPSKDEGEGKKPDPKAVGALIDHLDMESLFWSLIEPAFYQLLIDLPKKENAKLLWQEQLKFAARKSLKKAAEAIGSDSAGLKARAKAEIKLEFSLSRLPDLQK